MSCCINKSSYIVWEVYANVLVVMKSCYLLPKFRVGDRARFESPGHVKQLYP